MTDPAMPTSPSAAPPPAAAKKKKPGGPHGSQVQLKTALRKVVEQFKTEIRLTPSQNLIITNVAALNIEAINRVLKEHGVVVENQATPVRAASMASSRDWSDLLATVL